MADTGTTSVTAFANELWFAILGDTVAFDWLPPSNGFTEVSDQNSTTISLAFEEKIVGGTGTANTAAGHMVVPLSGAWVGAIATFKDVSQPSFIPKISSVL